MKCDVSSLEFCSRSNIERPTPRPRGNSIFNRTRLQPSAAESKQPDAHVYSDEPCFRHCDQHGTTGCSVSESLTRHAAGEITKVRLEDLMAGIETHPQI